MTVPGSSAGTRTVPARDRFMDLVRVACMSAVVLLHWLSVMPYWRGDELADVNVVEVVPGLWPFTWAGDVMALFFFVGGFANWVSFETAAREGRPMAAYLRRRWQRLVVPTLVFLGAWLAADLVARLVAGRDAAPLSHVSIGNTIPFGPLWFLGVYLVLVTLTPWTIAAHRRWRLGVPVTMTLLVLAADLAAFRLDSGVPLVGNLLLVWAIPHQLGYFYADGTLRRLSERGCLAIMCGGLLALVALTSLPAYPRCLLCPRWTVLTIDAPTLSLVVAGLWLVGLALSVRRPVTRWLDDPRRWRVVARLNDLTMPVYLWHMTAYLLAALLLGGLGFVWGTDPTATWWWGRPAMVAVSGTILVGILVIVRAAVRSPVLTGRWRRSAGSP